MPSLQCYIYHPIGISRNHQRRRIGVIEMIPPGLYIYCSVVHHFHELQNTHNRKKIIIATLTNALLRVVGLSYTLALRIHHMLAYTRTFFCCTTGLEDAGF